MKKGIVENLFKIQIVIPTYKGCIEAWPSVLC
jgi:hypothetical protein